MIKVGELKKKLKKGQQAMRKLVQENEYKKMQINEIKVGYQRMF